MSKYWKKLQDPRWHKLRLEVFKRDEFKCVGCGNMERTLNVHHHSYHGDPWEAPSDELSTLCSQCHGNLETAIKELRMNPEHDIVPFILNRLLKSLNDGEIVPAISVLKYLTEKVKD